MRTMTNSFEGQVFYASAFHEGTGAIARVVEVPEDMDEQQHRSTPSLAGWLADLKMEESDSFPDWSSQHQERERYRTSWGKKFSWGRQRAFSPVPETLDVQITNWCNFGCDVCYQESTPKGKHASKGFIQDILKSFKIPPYQVAFGGGEPTAHPNFPEILRVTKELGPVPNFTTAGHLFKKEITEAANEVCGGVALTYHPFKGADWFKKTYQVWREALRIQMNVHVIADVTVLKALQDLLEMSSETGPMNIVLLAYYPTGRGTLKNILPKSIYQEKLPAILLTLREKGFQISFSEGLLPYFFSRPELGIDLSFAERSEGLYSAYVDRTGRMSHSSFEPPRLDQENLYQKSLQEQWDHGPGWLNECARDECYPCEHRASCAQPDFTHAMTCKKMAHNQPEGRGDFPDANPGSGMSITAMLDASH